MCIRDRFHGLDAVRAVYVLLQLQQSADPIAVFIVACIGMRMKILRQLRAGQYLLGLVAFRTVRMFFLSADQVVVCIVATVAMRVLRLRAYQMCIRDRPYTRPIAIIAIPPNVYHRVPEPPVIGSSVPDELET